MTTNRKGRSGWHQAAHKASKSTRDITAIAYRIKAFVVTLTVWDWLTDLSTGGELHDE